MITIQKTGQDEAQLKVDTIGASQILAALVELRNRNDAKGNFIAMIDSRLLGAKTQSMLELTIQLKRQNIEKSDGSLARHGNGVVWNLVEGEGEIDYAIQQLKEGLENGYFFPAEFLMIQTPKSARLIQLFAVIAQ